MYICVHSLHKHTCVCPGRAVGLAPLTYVYIHMYIQIYICIYVYTYTCSHSLHATYGFAPVGKCSWPHLSVYVHTHVHIYTYSRIHTRKIHTCGLPSQVSGVATNYFYIYLYIYIYIHIHAHYTLTICT